MNQADCPSLVDPFEAIGPLCASIVLGFLPSRDLARSGAVSRSWRALALRNERLWSPHLQRLWEGKVYVPTELRTMAEASPRAALVASLADSVRQEMSEPELCAFTWRLHFKNVSWFGPLLASLAVRRHFNPNHTLTALPNDPLWGEEEPQRHYWYFRPGPSGRTVLQVNTYPCLAITRTEDWGWELENAVVRLTIDAEAGPNPGLPPGHPAAAETMSLEDIQERFHFAVLMQDLGEGAGEEEELMVMEEDQDAAEEEVSSSESGGDYGEEP